MRLAANTETDPIHRGIWVYEKLLAGFLADVPPDVDARVPERLRPVFEQAGTRLGALYVSGEGLVRDEMRALELFALVLINLNEFLYVD